MAMRGRSLPLGRSSSPSGQTQILQTATVQHPPEIEAQTETSSIHGTVPDRSSQPVRLSMRSGLLILRHSSAGNGFSGLQLNPL